MGRAWRKDLERASFIHSLRGERRAPQLSFLTCLMLQVTVIKAIYITVTQWDRKKVY